MFLPALACLLFSTASSTSQFMLLNQDGGYKYGYDTPEGRVTQNADSSNQVSGQYYVQDNLGQKVLVRYTAGVNGFVPEIVATEPEANQFEHNSISVQDIDGSYAFYYKTPDSLRQETGDAVNNVQGKYSYRNSAGSHDLQYVAGAETGFRVTGGSLAQPNGLTQQVREEVARSGDYPERSRLVYDSSGRQGFARSSKLGFESSVLLLPVANLYYVPSTDDVREAQQNVTSEGARETQENVTLSEDSNLIQENVTLTDGSKTTQENLTLTENLNTTQDNVALQENVRELESVDVGVDNNYTIAASTINSNDESTTQATNGNEEKVSEYEAADEKDTQASSVVQETLKEAPSEYTIDGNVVVYSYLPGNRQFGYYFKTL